MQASYNAEMVALLSSSGCSRGYIVCRATVFVITVYLATRETRLLSQHHLDLEGLNIPTYLPTMSLATSTPLPEAQAALIHAAEPPKVCMVFDRDELYSLNAREICGWVTQNYPTASKSVMRMVAASAALRRHIRSTTASLWHLAMCSMSLRRTASLRPTRLKARTPS